MFDLVGNSYYLMNDWFGLKKYSLYVRVEFCPTSFVVGVDFRDKRLVEINLLWFRIILHWLKKNKKYWGKK